MANPKLPKPKPELKPVFMTPLETLRNELQVQWLEAAIAAQQRGVKPPSINLTDLTEPKLP